MGSQYQELEQQALAVLKRNDRGTHTVPQEDMYPHAWLWDGGFISIGLSHVDARRAATELDTIFGGQWDNGMIANMRFNSMRPDWLLWNSRLNRYSPHFIHTSGITQPPILAEAVQRVSHRLNRDDRRAFTNAVLGRLASYHQWIYDERNPNGNGLFTAVHPWETGMENMPTWIEHMRTLNWGLRGAMLRSLNKVIQLARRDTKHTPADQRPNSEESLLHLQSFMSLRNNRYDHKRLADKHPLHVEDVQLNSILIRNNEILEKLSDEYKCPLPDTLRQHMAQTRTNIEQLWDDESGLYYPRDAVSGQHIKIATIASLLPLYAGSIRQERADSLVVHLQDSESFNAPYGVPTVPQNSPYFREKSYWSGPTWVNSNWLLIEGLKRSRHKELARQLGKSTLNMIEVGGLDEYFSPLTANGLGAKSFSWTAALALDLINQFSD